MLDNVVHSSGNKEKWVRWSCRYLRYREAED
jgi:hypothetical protein